MLLSVSAIAPQTPISYYPNFLLFPNYNNSTKNHLPRQSHSTFKQLNASSSLSTTNSTSDVLHHVTRTHPEDEPPGGSDAATMVSSAAAVASAIRGASTSPVEFLQMIEKDRKTKLVLPSPDFQRLCVEQLDLFRRIIDPDAILSVYVRPAGSYVMDRLELRRVTCYPGVNTTDIIIVVGNFSIPTGLRAAEAALSSQQVEVVPEHSAVVFPMVKHPFVVGFLVAELPVTGQRADSEGQNFFHCPSPEEAHALPLSSDAMSRAIQSVDIESSGWKLFTADQRSNAINISRSLAMAYVMDQKAMLLQQSSWQNNVRMSSLVEQIRGPLSTIRTLTKMLSVHTKKSEIAHDIMEDILVQGDQIRGTLQELQDAVRLTKANILRFNKETLKKMRDAHHESMGSHLSDTFSRGTSIKNLQNFAERLSLGAGGKDLEMPMPPLMLEPLHNHAIRPCNVSDVLLDLVEAVRPLARKQQRVVELCDLSGSLQVAVEEPALRQALSNLIEGALLRTHVGGKIDIMSTGAPAGGTLVVIDDDGPDMHYMTQTHTLAPFGSELLSETENMVEDNMTWNFVAGLAVAREVLENYGCVVRVISPRSTDVALGAGGTRIEIWLPPFSALSDLSEQDHEA